MTKQVKKTAAVAIESQKVDEAQKSACKELYFNFLTIAAISKKTGVATKIIHRWVYGEADFQDTDRESWYYQRNEATDEEMREYRARNKYLGTILHSQAIEDMLNSMKALREKKDKKGNEVPLTPFDMDKLTSAIMNIQKLNQVADILNPPKTAPQDVNPPGATPLPLDDIGAIDMETVAFALKHDKGIQKLLKSGGLHEREFTAERENSGSHLDQQSSTAGGEQKTDSLFEVDGGADRADEAGSAVVGTSGETDSHGDVGKPVGSQEVKREGPRAARRDRSSDNDSGPDQSDRESGSSDSGDQSGDDFGERASEDPFADEFS